MIKTYENLRDKREALLNTVEEAEAAMMNAWRRAMDLGGKASGASAAAEHARCTAHYAAAIESLEAWGESPDGVMFSELNAYRS